jgi:hypothetical protein
MYDQKLGQTHTYQMKADWTFIKIHHIQSPQPLRDKKILPIYLHMFVRT